MLAAELEKLVEHDVIWEQAKVRALARLGSPFHLGGQRRAAREEVHDRANLR
jgi:hypothetical protein